MVIHVTRVNSSNVGSRPGTHRVLRNRLLGVTLLAFGMTPGRRYRFWLSKFIRRAKGTCAGSRPRAARRDAVLPAMTSGD